jgi:hypothetical protein
MNHELVTKKIKINPMCVTSPLLAVEHLLVKISTKFKIPYGDCQMKRV